MKGTVMIGGSSAAAELSTLVASAASPAIDRDERLARIARAQEAMRRGGMDALLIGAGASLRYFTGVTWGATERLVALLLPADGAPAIVCPTFELGSLAAELAVPARVLAWDEDEHPPALVLGELRAGATLALDPLLPYGVARRLGAGTTLADGAAIIDALRSIKSPAELALLAHAKAVTLAVHARAARILAPGIAASTVKHFIDDAHRALGTAGSTFCAVQFGRATAFPHGLPGDQILEEDQLVLVDTGCLVDGYHSDITRTYAFGRVEDEVRRVWEIEHAAQAAAFAAVRPGVACSVIDDAARAVLEQAGFGPDYRLPGLPHRTGHGIGLSIHEPPYLVRGDATPLATGMCFSNEPMIVVPERFGVRLEDHFHVTDDGAAWFTQPQPSIDQPFG
jgi:Xaa-Pro dipeptidase